MMKIRQTRLFLPGVIGIAISLLVVFIKISPFRCCACSPEGYRFYPLTFTLFQNTIFANFGACACNYETCVPTFYIIPFDLLFLSLVCLILSFTKIKITFLKTLIFLFFLALVSLGLIIPYLGLELLPVSLKGICGPTGMGPNYDVSYCDRTCSTDDDCQFTCGCGAINKNEICHDEGIVYDCEYRHAECKKGKCALEEITYTQ